MAIELYLQCAACEQVFKEEFVTCGGVPLKEIDMKTMQSKKCQGLYIAGEALDIDGVTGGFNFQSCWSAGYLAGTSLGLDVEKRYENILE